MTDDEVAALIRRDRIDVLMDFGGHTSSSRLLVMARKPAPVQIAYMLGHGYTSGLSAVDAFLADDALGAPGQPSACSPSASSVCRAFPSPTCRPRAWPRLAPCRRCARAM